MDNTTISWSPYTDKVQVSDSVVEAVVERLLNSEQSSEMLDIVLNYLRGYLEKIMDNPEMIKQQSEDRINDLINRKLYGESIIQRLTNIDQSISEIHRAITGYNTNWSSVCSPHVNLPICVRQELDDLRVTIDMLRSELHRLKNPQNP